RNAIAHPLNQKTLDKKLNATGYVIKALPPKHIRKVFGTVLERRAIPHTRPQHLAVPVKRKKRPKFFAAGLGLPRLFCPRGETHQLIFVLHRHHAGEISNFPVERTYGMTFVYSGDTTNLAVASDVDRCAESVSRAIARKNQHIFIHLSPAEVRGGRVAQVVVKAVNWDVAAAQKGR